MVNNQVTSIGGRLKTVFSCGPNVRIEQVSRFIFLQFHSGFSVYPVSPLLSVYQSQKYW